MALQIGQEWSPPSAKENLPTLWEFGNVQELGIGGRIIEFRNGYSAEDEKRGRIEKRMSETQQACMREMEIGVNPPIFNAFKVKTIEFVSEFITHDCHV
jgi:hypothetical protein